MAIKRSLAVESDLRSARKHRIASLFWTGSARPEFSPRVWRDRPPAEAESAARHRNRNLLLFRHGRDGGRVAEDAIIDGSNASGRRVNFVLACAPTALRQCDCGSCHLSRRDGKRPADTAHKTRKISPAVVPPRRISIASTRGQDPFASLFCACSDANARDVIGRTSRHINPSMEGRPIRRRVPINRTAQT